jgi:hypothetical protein
VGWSEWSNDYRKASKFVDCFPRLMYKLTVFTADAAKRQQFYIQQVVCKSQRTTVHQHILQMGVVNDYGRYLLTLKDSPKAVLMTKGTSPLVRLI